MNDILPNRAMPGFGAFGEVAIFDHIVDF